MAICTQSSHSCLLWSSSRAAIMLLGPAAAAPCRERLGGRAWKSPQPDTRNACRTAAGTGIAPSLLSPARPGHAKAPGGATPRPGTPDLPITGLSGHGADSLQDLGTLEIHHVRLCEPVPG